MSPPSAAPPTTLRVLSLPAGHRYVRHAVGEAPGIELLPDPPVPGGAPGQWWPSPALEPAWISAHHDELDVVHVHFGFESSTTAQLTLWVQELRRAGIPLVVTVHDHGNTSAASIPLALDVAVRGSQVKPGDTVMLEGVGGGFTWGAVLLNL